MLNEPDESGVVKAVVAEIDLGITVLDAYMLPDGEKRIGLENRCAIALRLGNASFTSALI